MVPPMLFDAVLFLVSALAGAIAAISGFGIGSLLTPLLSLQVGTKLAVAAIAIPHGVATAVRCWRMRQHVDRGVLLRFGLTSAAGGLAGALLHGMAQSPTLAAVFALLLVFVGASGLTGLAGRLRFRGPGAWIAGLLSGFFGGLVGNQGGIRAGALMGFDLSPQAFVATATATGLIVDGARLPVYLATQGGAILGVWPQVAIATLGAIAGTVAGSSALRRVPERIYRPLVSGLILALGVSMLVQAAMPHP